MPSEPSWAPPKVDVYPTPEAKRAAMRRFRETVLHNPWLERVRKPHRKQALFLLHDQVPEVLLGGSAGGAKALAVDTPLPTPFGWTTMQAVQPGDWLLADDGKPCRVLACSEVMQDHVCYAVEFSDGSILTADAGHRWRTLNLAERGQRTHRTEAFRAQRRAVRPSRGTGAHPWTAELNHSRQYTYLNPSQGTVRTTEELAATVRHYGRLNHSVAVTAPLDLPEVTLPLSPYVLGAWLGDGTTARSEITSADEEVINAIRGEGWPVVHRGGSQKYAWRIGKPCRAVRLGGRGLGMVNPFTRALQALGVLGNKHIPSSYLRGSLAQRLALLQGLMDTDGHVTDRGYCEFTTTLPALREGMLELLATLGVKAVARSGVAKLYSRAIGPCWKCKFLTDLPVFRLARKLRGQKRNGFRGTHAVRYVVDVRRVASVPVRCVQVDSPSHLYLAGRSMVPTHNSDALLMAALQYAIVPGHAALILRETFTDLSLPGALMDRAREWLYGTAARWNDREKTWHLPTGKGLPDATLTFGYLETDDQRYRYQSSEFQICCYDELTQFTETRYTYLFSRLRAPEWRCERCGYAVRRAPHNRLVYSLEGDWEHKPTAPGDSGERCLAARPKPWPMLAPWNIPLPDVPLRMRAATNPGGKGHQFCRDRFIPDGFRSAPHPERFDHVWWKESRLFVPARLEDNPSVNRETYIAGLQNLDPITRGQLLAGDWDAYQGGRFQRAWFERRWRMNPAGNYWLGRIDVNGCRVWEKDDWVGPAYCWRFGIVDPAATEKETADYTVIGVFAVTPDNRLLILDWRRERLAIDRIPDAIAQKCEQWELAWVGIEAVGGFKGLLATCRADVRCGAVRELMTEGKGKLARATPAIIRAESGGLYLPEQAPWVEEFVSELVQFTGDAKLDSADDQADCLSYACGAMVGLGGMYADCPVKEYPTGEPQAEKEPQRNAEGRGLFGLGDEPQSARSAFGRGRRRGFMGR